MPIRGTSWLVRRPTDPMASRRSHCSEQWWPASGSWRSVGLPCSIQSLHPSALRRPPGMQDLAMFSNCGRSGRDLLRLNMAKILPVWFLKKPKVHPRPAKYPQSRRHFKASSDVDASGGHLLPVPFFSIREQGPDQAGSLDSSKERVGREFSLLKELVECLKFLRHKSLALEKVSHSTFCKEEDG